jgi:hypothetical protein
MVEYGNGVGQVAGRAGGSGGGGGGSSTDVGASLGQFLNDSVHTVSTLPPAELLVGIVIVFLALIFLKRAL